MRGAPSTPHLFISVTLFKTSKGFYAYEVNLKVLQTAQLSNDSITLAGTYSTPGSVGIMSVADIHDVRDIVLDQVKVFINDWLKVHQ